VEAPLLPSSATNSAPETVESFRLPDFSGMGSEQTQAELSSKLLSSVPSQAKRLSNSHGQPPLSFEPNQGQANSEVKFLARGAGYQVFLTSTETVFTFNKITSETRAGKPKAETKRSSSKEGAVRMRLVGSDPTAEVTGDGLLPGKINYYRGNQRSKWQTGLSTYARVRYREVYPNIDVVYYGTRRQLEYDFVLSPGADPGAIGLRFSGVRRMRLDRNGDLLLHGERGAFLKQQKPQIYQEVDGKKRQIAGGYSLNRAGQVGFKVGSYDRRLPLVIDPVVVYATYLGGTCPPVCIFVNESAKDIATDVNGNSYVIGQTAALDFPTTNPLQPSFNGDHDMYITKYNSDGSAIIYSTYLGGFSADDGNGIAADASGNAYITGFTTSPDFPITIGDPLSDGEFGTFITKINSVGSALTYSLIVPFSSGKGIDVDASGNAYVTGGASEGFPLVNPLQPLLGSPSDAFVLKLNSSGSNVVYSTFLGGNNNDVGNAIAVDVAGNAYIGGETSSTNFPTLNPLQPIFGGGQSDGFVTKVNAVGSALVYSTYLGGENEDPLNDIAVDALGQANVTGATLSAHFPTANALQPSLGIGIVRAYVSKLRASGSAFVYSTYLGGSSGENGNGIAVDGAGNTYVTGLTSSPDFPIVNAFQPNMGGSEGQPDAFVSKLNPFGTVLIYSSYFGGSSVEIGVEIAADNNGNAYVLGETFSGDFPTVNPRQPQYAGGLDAFVAKISDNSMPCGEDVTNRVAIIKSSFSNFLLPSLQVQAVLLVNKTNSPIRGPITFVPDDMTDSFLVNSSGMTKCYSIGGDRSIAARPGPDNILSPGEGVVVTLLFFRLNTNQQIEYTERVVSRALSN
jgi:hypothetical protein